MRQKIIVLLWMIVVVALVLLFAERDMVIGTKQFEALVSLCERHNGLARVIYRRESDVENLDFDSRPIPKHIVCRDNTKLPVPKRIQKMNYRTAIGAVSPRRLRSRGSSPAFISYYRLL